MIKKRTLAGKTNIRRNRSNLESITESDVQTATETAQQIIESAKNPKPKSTPKPQFLSFDTEEMEPMIPKKSFVRSSISQPIVPNISVTHEYKTIDKRGKKHRHGTQHTTRTTAPKIVTPIALFDQVDNGQMLLADDESLTKKQIYIPDALTIKHAKEQRKRLREEGSTMEEEEDSNTGYIPLNSNTAGLGSNQPSTSLVVAPSKSTESRLVRDDDSDEEDNQKDDVFDDLRKNRITFGKPVGDVKKSVRERIKEDDMMDDDEEDEKDKPDEDQEWELLQLKSAGIIPPPMKPKSAITVDDDDDLLSKRVKKSEAMIVDEDYDTIAELPTFDQLEKQLKAAFQELESSHAQESQNLEKTQAEMQDRAQRQSFLKQELDDLSEKYTFYQDMKAYIEDLLDCLDTKVPDIEILEEQLINEREQYHERLYQNWLQEQIKSGNGISVKQSSSDEWWLADYILPQNVTIEYQETIQNIVKQSRTIFDDVQEEYCSLSHIRQKFEAWKYSQPESYRDTYCGLCAQKVFAPFVRLEMMTNMTQMWFQSPLVKPTFIDFTWWKELLYYGVKDDMKQDGIDENDDHMVPELIKKIVTPLIIHTASRTYCPLSTSETRALQKLIDEYLDYVQGDEIKQVFESIVNRLKRFTKDIKLPLKNGPISPAIYGFIQRQFMVCLHLLQSIVTWYDVFNSKHVFDWHHSLRSLALEDLIKTVTYLINHDAVPRQEKLEWKQLVQNISKLPDEWRSQLVSM
jgi:hypothetical protein